IHGAESDARPGDQSQLDEQRAYLPLLGGSDGRARRLRSRAASGASLLGGSGASRLLRLLRLRRLRGLLLGGGRLRRLIGRRLLLILFWLGTLRLCRLQRPLGGVNRSALCLRIWRLSLRLLWLRLSIGWRLWLVGGWRRSSLRLCRWSIGSRSWLRRLRLVTRLLRAQ